MNVSVLRPDTKKRLLYAKYLLERSRNAQRERAELGFAVSLLLMHDATEMVMLSVLDGLNLKKSPKNHDFMEFWKTVEEYDRVHHPGRKSPPSRTAMESMNKARVDLKHYGLLPNMGTVRDFQPRVESFCERIAETYLGTDLSELSLADLIDNEKARDLLRKAEQEFAAGDKKEAVTSMRWAFDALERELDSDLRPIDANSMMYFEESEALKEIANSVNVLTLGIDPLRYRFFHKHTPLISLDFTNPSQRVAVFLRPFTDISEPVFRTCVDFVVEFALRAAELFREPEEE